MTTNIINNKTMRWGCFFKDKTIESAIISNDVKTIDNLSFMSCTNLKELIISESVEEIGNYALSGCGFKSLVIPNSVKKIGHWALKDCKNLEHLTIPDSTVKNIEFINSLSGCDNLRKLTYCGKTYDIKIVDNHLIKIVEDNLMALIPDVTPGIFVNISCGYTVTNFENQELRLGKRIFLAQSQYEDQTIGFGDTEEDAISELVFNQTNKFGAEQFKGTDIDKLMRNSLTKIQYRIISGSSKPELERALNKNPEFIQKSVMSHKNLICLSNYSDENNYERYRDFFVNSNKINTFNCKNCKLTTPNSFKECLLKHKIENSR